MHLVVGLGNPGARYARTRHNVGFRVVERLAERCGTTVERKQFGALVGEATLQPLPPVPRPVTGLRPESALAPGATSGVPGVSGAGAREVAPTPARARNQAPPATAARAVLVMPQQFMNLSGQPAASVAGFYKVPTDRMVVIHDDMDLPFGRVRVRVGGGHAGHNGVRDIQRACGADFVRVKLGVGRPPPDWDPADYVLAPFPAPEEASVQAMLDLACDAVACAVTEGAAPAMNRFNAATPERAA